MQGSAFTNLAYATMLAVPICALGPPLRAAQLYDGRYDAAWTNTLNSHATTCTPGPLVSLIEVTGDRFSIRWAAQRVPVVIADDGTIKGSALVQQGRDILYHVTITGHASPSGMEAEIGGPACRYHVTMNRR